MTTTTEQHGLLDYLNVTAETITGVHKKNGTLGQNKFNSIAELIIKQGRGYDPAPLPGSVKPGIAHHCYLNAFQLAHKNPFRYVYVEGIASSEKGIIPVNHAWCVDLRNNLAVVDPTWVPKNIGCFGKLYYGVPLNLKYVTKTLLAKKTYGVIDNMDQGFPLLTGEHDIATAIDQRGLVVPAQKGQ